MGEGDDTSTKGRHLRRAAPTGSGPLGSSGAAPDPAGPADGSAGGAVIPEQASATAPAPAGPQPADAVPPASTKPRGRRRKPATPPPPATDPAPRGSGIHAAETTPIGTTTAGADTTTAATAGADSTTTGTSAPGTSTTGTSAPGTSATSAEGAKTTRSRRPRAKAAAPTVTTVSKDGAATGTTGSGTTDDTRRSTDPTAPEGESAPEGAAASAGPASGDAAKSGAAETEPEPTRTGRRRPGRTPKSRAAAGTPAPPAATAIDQDATKSTGTDGAGKTTTGADGAGKTTGSSGAADGGDTAKDGTGKVPEGGPSNPGPAPARRIRRWVPLPSKQAVRAAPGAVRAWSRKPLGRLMVPGVVGALLIGAATGLGAYLVPTVWAAAPAAVPSEAPSAPASSFPGPAPGVGSEPRPPAADVPGATPGVQPGGRPADALAGWAAQVSAKSAIPVTAVQAYGYAELVAARTTPNCRLSWTTLAAIGKVESDHGSANKATLGPDGQALPAIKGLPLDGQGGRMLIKDSDGGVLDGDPTFDRAMGPMQFIPTTWKETAVDADNNGVTDPNDIDDAALAAANYLCKGGRNMSTSEDWWAAILSYNDVQRYAQDVFTYANDYGTRSRT